MNTGKSNWGRSFPLRLKNVSRTISISFCSGGLQLNREYILVFSVYGPQSPASNRTGVGTLEGQRYIWISNPRTWLGGRENLVLCRTQLQLINEADLKAQVCSVTRPSMHKKAYWKKMISQGLLSWKGIWLKYEHLFSCVEDKHPVTGSDKSVASFCPKLIFLGCIHPPRNRWPLVFF